MEFKLFKNKKVWRKGGIHMNPDIVWDVLQASALAIVIGACIYGFFLFKAINKEFILSNEATDAQVKTISKDRIDKVLQYYSDKSKSSTDITNSPSPIADPSK